MQKELPQMNTLAAGRSNGLAWVFVCSIQGLQTMYNTVF